MPRKIVYTGACFVSLLLSASLFPADGQSYRSPLGVYAHVNVDTALKREFGDKTPKAETEHAYLRGLYATLLKDKAVSGISLGVHWDRIEISDPSCNLRNDCLPPTQATDGYDWSWLDDAFTVANRSGASVQLILTPGVDSPPWLFTLLEPSCDALFEPSTGPPQHDCGEVTFSSFPEEQNADGKVFPLPWNTTYQKYWAGFLTQLRDRYVLGPAPNPAFVSIAIAGPIGASTEMILPTTLNGGLQNPNEPADKAWSALIANSFPDSTTGYQHSDQIFINQWKQAIKTYEGIFQGLTVYLAADAGNDLPEYPYTPPPHPTWLFEDDCTEAADYPMSCAAKTNVLLYFLGRAAEDRKATLVGGMTASDPPAPGKFGMGIPGVKVLTSLATENPRILGGAEFDYAVTDPMKIQQQGCPQYPRDPPDCQTLTVEEAAYNTLKVFFDGTRYAGYYGGTEADPEAPSEALVQWVELDYIDIRYAQTHPHPTLPTTVPCSPSLQELLDRASWDLFKMAGKTPPVPEPPACDP